MENGAAPISIERKAPSVFEFQNLNQKFQEFLSYEISAWAVHFALGTGQCILYTRSIGYDTVSG